MSETTAQGTALNITDEMVDRIFDAACHWDSEERCDRIRTALAAVALNIAAAAETRAADWEKQAAVNGRDALAAAKEATELRARLAETEAAEARLWALNDLYANAMHAGLREPERAGDHLRAAFAELDRRARADL